MWKLAKQIPEHFLLTFYGIFLKKTKWEDIDTENISYNQQTPRISKWKEPENLDISNISLSFSCICSDNVSMEMN